MSKYLATYSGPLLTFRGNALFEPGKTYIINVFMNEKAVLQVHRSLVNEDAVISCIAAHWGKALALKCGGPKGYLNRRIGKTYTQKTVYED